jgi:hypothetical protein
MELSDLNPPAEWQPDAAAALARIRARREPVRRLSWKWPTFALAGLLAAVALAPGTRALAQRLWQSLTVRPMAFVRVNEWPAGVPSPQIQVTGLESPPVAARDMNQVSARVGYTPRMPRAGVLEGMPQLYTKSSVSAGFTIRAADLRLALSKAGASGLTVPAQWDGARLAVHTGDVAIAEWPEVALAQSLPLTLTAPDGFDFPAFSALVLRIQGVDQEDAVRLAAAAGTIPPWLVPVSQGMLPKASLEEVMLASSPAALMQEPPGPWGLPGKIAILWSAPDRVYLLTGTVSRELMLAVANAVQ